MKKEVRIRIEIGGELVREDRYEKLTEDEFARLKHLMDEFFED
jgi:hypothetical protein